MDAKKDTPAAALQRVILKYQRELSLIDKCPGPSATFGGLSYRAVHEDLGHPDNFTPIALRDPARLERESSSEKRCSLWGLSMFESVEKLRSMIKRVERTNRKFRDLVGHYYVELQLSHSNGHRTASSSMGHFDLHPSVSFEPKDCIRLHEVLPP